MFLSHSGDLIPTHPRIPGHEFFSWIMLNFSSNLCWYIVGGNFCLDGKRNKLIIRSSKELITKNILIFFDNYPSNCKEIRWRESFPCLQDHIFCILNILWEWIGCSFYEKKCGIKLQECHRVNLNGYYALLLITHIVLMRWVSILLYTEHNWTGIYLTRNNVTNEVQDLFVQSWFIPQNTRN